MSFLSIWTTLLIALHALDPVTLQAIDYACAEGDFCTYQCHCNNACPIPDGVCLNNAKCDQGWFGLRCQYKDLLTVAGATVTFESQHTTSAWLTDRDDSTCNTDPNLQSVTVSWDREYPFTWIRIVMTNSIMMSSIRVYYNIASGYQECVKVRWSRFGKGTMDIRCEDNVKMKSLRIVGDITSLCSLYISGGRNLAYKQNATQSSTYIINTTPYGASLAVDGNSISDFFQGKSCSHTADPDAAPRFDLKFNSAYVVKQFAVYNRNTIQERLRGFRLQTMDVDNTIVDNFKDNSTTPQMIYFINGNATNTIILMTVNEIQRFGSETSPYLTLCEVEAFGECPQGKWSLPCTKLCNTSCPTSCHRDDGSCNTVCAGYSNPPECTNICPPSKWGINCGNDCSTRCVATSCDSKTGLCDRGCIGYSDPPYCTRICSRESWGINCSQPCSSNCMTNSCNVFTGACDQGCNTGYQLPDCTQECQSEYWGVNCNTKCNNKCYNGECKKLNGNCSFGCKEGFQLPDCTTECQSGYWGINCSTKCNKNCYNGECNPVNGKCNFGCKEGFQLPDCTTECKIGSYGRNCSRNCSPNCIDGTCDSVNGGCICRTGYEGNTSIQEPISDSKTVGDGFGAGIGVGIGIMVILDILVLVIVVLCIKLRRRSTGPKAQTENVLAYDKSNARDDDLHTYEQVTDDTSASDEPNATKDRCIAMQHLPPNSNKKDTTSAYENIYST